MKGNRAQVPWCERHAIGKGVYKMDSYRNHFPVDGPEDEAAHRRNMARMGDIITPMEAFIRRAGITDPNLLEGIRDRVMDLLDELTQPKYAKSNLIDAWHDALVADDRR